MGSMGKPSMSGAGGQSAGWRAGRFPAIVGRKPKEQAT
jgi:hypothetical protein